MLFIYILSLSFLYAQQGGDSGLSGSDPDMLDVVPRDVSLDTEQIELVSLLPDPYGEYETLATHNHTIRNVLSSFSSLDSALSAAGDFSPIFCNRGIVCSQALYGPWGKDFITAVRPPNQFENLPSSYVEIVPQSHFLLAGPSRTMLNPPPHLSTATYPAKRTAIEMKAGGSDLSINFLDPIDGGSYESVFCINIKDMVLRAAKDLAFSIAGHLNIYTHSLHLGRDNVAISATKVSGVDLIVPTATRQLKVEADHILLGTSYNAVNPYIGEFYIGSSGKGEFALPDGKIVCNDIDAHIIETDVIRLKHLGQIEFMDGSILRHTATGVFVLEGASQFFVKGADVIIEPALDEANNLVGGSLEIEGDCSIYGGDLMVSDGGEPERVALTVDSSSGELLLSALRPQDSDGISIKNQSGHTRIKWKTFSRNYVVLPGQPAQQVVFDSASVRGNFLTTSESPPANIDNLDYAEYIKVFDKTISYGDILSISNKKDLYGVKSESAKSSLVIGIVSKSPGFALGEQQGSVPLALVGRVYCHVSGENGDIHRGDLISAGPQPGYGVKLVGSGHYVGKAMQDCHFKAPHEKRMVVVWANLGYYKD